MRKFLLGALALVTAGLVSAPGAFAATTSTSIATSGITIDYANQTLTVKTDSAKDLEVGFSVVSLKSTKDKKTNDVTTSISAPADANWEWYDNSGTVVIDLSTLSNTKDNYIQVKGDKTLTTPVTIKIPAVLTKVSAAYDGSTGKVTLSNTTDKQYITEVTDAIQYKTQYSGWATYTAGTTDLSKYAYRGASLTFRVAPSTAANDTAVSKLATEEIGDTTVYDAKSFPGKELKVKITKLAAGPKIAVNYLTGEITIPAGAQYRTTAASATKHGDWTTNDDTNESNGKAVVRKITPSLKKSATYYEGATVEVRTPADASKKKAASKASKLDYAEQGVVKAVLTTNSKTVATASTDISTVTIDSKITVAYNAKKDSIILTNGTADIYEVIVVTDGSTPTMTTKATGTVKAGKSVTNDGTTTINAQDTTVKAAADSVIYIRKKGNAKTGVWTTNPVVAGKVSFPASTEAKK
jgi:hypothetical protein